MRFVLVAMAYSQIIFFSVIAIINRSETLSLNGAWSINIEDFGGALTGYVPGGIYTDLSNAHLIPDSFKEANDVRNRWIANRTVVYTKQFTVEKTMLEAPRVFLIFDGLDTFSTIFVNNHEIGETENMFLRYVFDVKDYLEVGANYVNVTFNSAVKVAEDLYNKQSSVYIVPPKCVPEQYNGECHVNHIRKMQASFAWDWGPAFPSMGIWKKVELVPVKDAVMIDSSADVIDYGDNWEIVVEIFCRIRSGSSLIANLTLTLEYATSVDIEVSKEIWLNTDSLYLTQSIAMSVPKKWVELWWPNGYGHPKLYTLRIKVTTPHNVMEHKKRIGFRKIELIQDNIEKGRTFYFKVNDVPIFAKGSNWIPASIFPELSSQENVLRDLLTSAKEVHMNMLRVWGGGYYESNLFYELADELGIMIWQDFMFACSMYPTNVKFLNSVREEIRQNVYRLKHHPSIVIWAGNNENEAALYGNWYGTGKNPIYEEDYLKLYVDVLKREVEKLDATRPFVVSSPSDGSWTDENGYIGPNPYSNLYGDVHYYNYLLNGWDINRYPIPRFSSEYGFQSIPSMETLNTATNTTENLQLGSKFLDHRQHLVGGWAFMKLLIAKNLLIPQSNDSHRDFHDYIYLSQVNQAVSMKIQTESYRQFRSSLNELGEGYTMGALYWQLNDVWQAPSWSSIEFGGRWKMLHYYAKDFFAPIIVSPRLSKSDSLTIFIVSDKLTPIAGCHLNLHVYKWNSTSPHFTKTFKNITIVANGAQIVDTLRLSELLEKASCGNNISATKNCFVELVLNDTTEKLVAPINYVYPAPLKTIQLPKIVIAATINPTPLPGKLSNHLDYEISIDADGIALFVWLDIPHKLGRFSENGFHVLGKTKSVTFHATSFVTAEELSGSLKITTLNEKGYPNY